ncbi:GNAT family protein [Paludibacterium sp. THUN1379]|uniref:GNAT family N-acetyltransferase n=1 Tax=Paludibacterium sp. THUN1379 TaxID=3112107 RepID=UPI0030D11502
MPVCDALCLRQLAPRDIDAWFRLLSDERVTRHTSWALASSRDLDPLVQDCLATTPDSPIRFAVLRQADQALVGTIGFHTISSHHGTAEIAYEFAAEAWGKGWASACCQAVTEWGFRLRGYGRIQGTVLESNPASARVLQKCGFVLEGRLRHFRRVRGVPRDYLLYARLADSPII